MYKILHLNNLQKDRAILKNALWNLFDTFFTQLLLIIHNCCLQRFLGHQFHGELTFILAIFYTLITVLNFGLDYTLPFFVKSYAFSKNSLKYFLKTTILHQFVFISIFTIVSIFLFIFFNKHLNYNLKIDSFNIIIIGAAFILESIRKTIRNFLQLVLSSKFTAIVETVSTYSYIAILWLIYLFNFVVNIDCAFGLLLLISLIQNILLFYILYLYYCRLSEGLDNYRCANFKKIRFYNAITQISSQLFSTNFLISICILYLNLNKISNLKIFFSIAQFISLIIIKNLSTFLNTLFLHDYSKYDNLFKKIAKIFHQGICFLFLFLLINYNNINFHFIAFLLVFIEPFFIFYEKVFILEKSPLYIAIFNLLGFIGIFLINNKENYSSLCYMLFFILLIRIFSIVFLSLTSLKNKFDLNVNIKLRFKFIFFYLLLAFLYKIFYLKYYIF